MKNELGIEVCCANCEHLFECYIPDLCDNLERFTPSANALKIRIKQLQLRQFTEAEAEKVETFLTIGYQMLINENKEIFSKLEKMKGELK